MWTAAHIFLYGTLPYLMKGNIRKLLWSGVSIFFHFSFIFPVAILLLFVFLRNRINIYIVLFVITSFIKEIDLELVQSALSFLPAIFRHRVSIYTNLEYAEAISSEVQSVNWYISFSSIAIKWVIYIMSLFIYLVGRKFLKDRKDLMTMFCFSLLLYSLSNVFSLVPSGGRFLVISSALMFAFYIIFINAFPEIRGFNFIQVLSIPLLLLFCIVAIRMGMDYFGLTTIIGNPIFAIFDPDPVPIITKIKGLF